MAGRTKKTVREDAAHDPAQRVLRAAAELDAALHAAVAAANDHAASVRGDRAKVAAIVGASAGTTGPDPAALRGLADSAADAAESIDTVMKAVNKAAFDLARPMGTVKRQIDGMRSGVMMVPSELRALADDAAARVDAAEEAIEQVGTAVEAEPTEPAELNGADGEVEFGEAGLDSAAEQQDAELLGPSELSA